MTYIAIAERDSMRVRMKNWVFLELESALQRNSPAMKSSAQFKHSRTPSGLLIPLILACFALSKNAQGVVPPPDGGHPNFTTAEGTKAFKA
jgi:hypothetical protein